MTINERLLKFKAAHPKDLIYLDQDLEMDSEVELVITGQVVEITDKTLNDGSVDRIFTVKGQVAVKE